MPGRLKQTTQKLDSPKPAEMEEKHFLGQNLHQDIFSVVPTHHPRGSNRELHSFFAYFGPDSNFNFGYKHY